MDSRIVVEPYEVLDMLLYDVDKKVVYNRFSNLVTRDILDDTLN
jgi:hypothetical protein